ncbi:GTA baseplate fiber-binding domain-containing protein [Isoalcanivorax beigongshangi]|uniref:Phage tail protein n=1 Tax=Isoalcanivorax beigongshangi TaxID=3238810 RepID=A0ABV4AIB3_9GAMM
MFKIHLLGATLPSKTCPTFRLPQFSIISAELNRKDAITVPRVLHLEYFDIDGGLSADKQTSDRSLDNRSVSETKIQTAVLMGADDAARSVVINHKISTEEQRGTYEFSLPEQYIWLAVGDCISLDSQRLRIIEIEIDDGLQNYKAVFDRRSAYQTTVQGVPVERPIDPPSLVVAGTVLHFIDSHILRDADDRLGFYVAVSGAGEGWSGARVELSTDGGETFIESVDAYTDADTGVLDAPLPAHPVWYPDTRNTLRVAMARTDMEFESADLRGMQNRQNLALVGDEIVSLGNAEEVEPGIWEFTHLLRGRKGSPIATHPAGTRFVSLERSQLWFIDAELYMLASELTFRATSFGASESSTASAVFLGRSQAERQPSYLSATRRGGELIIDWQGVGRLGGGARVSMGAHFTGFDVTVNGAAPVLVQQPPYRVADPGSGAVVSVSQINRFTGPGPASEIVI